MSEVVRCFRVNVVNLNLISKQIEPSDIYHWFHPDCYQKWLDKQSKRGSVFSYSMAELEVDVSNVQGIDCHRCQKPIARETIVL